MTLTFSRDHYRPSKDRPWDYDRLAHYSTIDFFLRKGYDIKQIAVELNRRQEWVEARIAELPLFRPLVEARTLGHENDLRAHGNADGQSIIRATLLA